MVPSVLVLCQAALMRMALHTLPQWPALRDRLVQTAIEHLPIARWACDRPWPAFWQSPAFVCTLAAASSREDAASREAVRALRDHEEARSAMPEAGRVRVQSLLSRSLHSSLLPADWPALLLRRLGLWFSAPPSCLGAGGWDALCRVLLTIPPSWRLGCMRTWLGGWVTTTRMRNPDARCCFGCEGPDARDSMKHYLCGCRPFEWLWARAIRHDLHACPWRRLGITDPSVPKCREVVIAYHLHRLLHRDRNRAGGVITFTPEAGLELARAAVFATDMVAAKVHR